MKVTKPKHLTYNKIHIIIVQYKPDLKYALLRLNLLVLYCIVFRHLGSAVLHSSDNPVLSLRKIRKRLLKDHHLRILFQGRYVT